MDILPIITTGGSILVGMLGSTGLTTWLQGRAERKKVNAAAEVDLSTAMLKWQETLMARIVALETEVRACHVAHVTKDQEIGALRAELDTMKASLASRGVI